MNKNDYPLLADAIKVARASINSLDPAICRKYEKDILLTGVWFTARAIAASIRTTRHDFDPSAFLADSGCSHQPTTVPPAMTECPLCRTDYKTTPGLMLAVKVKNNVQQYVCFDCMNLLTATHYAKPGVLRNTST